MRQGECMYERDKESVCEKEKEIMYLDKKETLRMSNHEKEMQRQLI